MKCGAKRDNTMVICPVCGARHYWLRKESMVYHDGGVVEVGCRCGQRYQVYRSENGALTVRGK